MDEIIYTPAAKARAAAAGVAALGVNAGDRVVAVCGNRAEAVVACLAATTIGRAGSPMRPAGLLLAALAMLLDPAPAAAVTETQVALAASSGFTDNALGATDDGSPKSDAFFSLSPALTVASESLRYVFRSLSGVTLSRYLGQSQANTITASEGLALDYDIAKTVHSSFTLNATYTDGAAPEPQAVVGAVPVGGARYFELGGGLSLGKDFSASLRGVENVRATLHLPLGDDERRRAMTLENGLAVQVSRPRDAFEARLIGGVNLYDAGPLETSGDGVYRAAFVGSWFHELSPSWSTMLSGGAALVSSDRGLGASPQATLRIEHHRDLTSFRAELAQGVSANPQVAETFAASSATLGMDVRFAETLSLGVAGGGVHGTTVGGGPERRVDTAQASVQLAWAILQNLALTASYQLVYQVTDDAMAGQSKLMRNVVFGGVSAYWPQFRVGGRPQGMPLRVRQSEELQREQREQGAGQPD